MNFCVQTNFRRLFSPSVVKIKDLNEKGHSWFLLYPVEMLSHGEDHVYCASWWKESTLQVAFLWALGIGIEWLSLWQTAAYLLCSLHGWIFFFLKMIMIITSLKSSCISTSQRGFCNGGCVTKALHCQVRGFQRGFHLLQITCFQRGMWTVQNASDGGWCKSYHVTDIMHTPNPGSHLWGQGEACFWFWKSLVCIPEGDNRFECKGGKTQFSGEKGVWKNNCNRVLINTLLWTTGICSTKLF